MHLCFDTSLNFDSSMEIFTILISPLPDLTDEVIVVVGDLDIVGVAVTAGYKNPLCNWTGCGRVP